MTTATLTLAEATAIVREAVRDKSYQLLPLGEDVAAYLLAKRKRLTASSYRVEASELTEAERARVERIRRRNELLVELRMLREES